MSIFKLSLVLSFFFHSGVGFGAEDLSTQEMTSATRACFESTCGKDYALSHPFDTSLKAYSETHALTDKILKRPIELLMGRVIHQSVVRNGIYQKLSKMNLAPIEGSSKGLLQAMLYLQNMQTYLGTIVADKDGSLMFDQEKLKALPEKLSDAEISAIHSLKELIPILRGQSIISAGLSYRQILKYLYPHKSLIESQKLEAQEIINSIQNLVKILPGLRAMSEYDLVVQRALAGNTLSEAEMSYLQGQTAARFIYGILLNSNVLSEFQKIPLNPNELMQKQYQVYQNSSVALAVQNPKSIKKILQNSITDCSVYLSYSYAALPMQMQIDNFNLVLKKIETTAQQMIEEKSHTSLDGKFDFEVIVPIAKEQVMPQWVNFLNQATTEAEKRIQVSNSMNLADPEIQASTLLMMVTDSSRELFENVSSFCHQTKPAFLDDALLRTDNSIQLSWPTIVHPEMGAPIIAHEIGHAIQNAWPGAILSENICLITKQGGSQYLSEDFADLFSTEVMRRLGGVVNGLQTKNLGCGLVAPTGDRGLLTFNNTDKSDSHSSALYRLLASAAGQKKMTQECSAYLAKTGETRFVDYCRWGE